MTFTQLELQQIVNAVLCSDPKYIEGQDNVQKSITIVKLATEIKEQNGKVELSDICLRIYR